IGKNCIIAAGALVPEEKDIPEGSVVMGVPGKVVRDITDRERDQIRENAQEYRERAERYREGLTQHRNGK
ncbi:MAG: gamma carbonic anhydrase family protein, partial [Candidatus Nanohaloarchaea archaeon]|nr:gamma carbonic anhydrase family protein [Candidatus Nanohaloarchaea archaeon]